MFHTIAAISSGLVNQPISIIRLSGSESLNILQKVFSQKVDVNKPNKMVLGYIVKNKGMFNESKLDEVLVVYFQAPHSFTGEDMVEIYAHGGIFNTQRILQLLFAHGARQANRGEFSLRSVLNGKMDLIKAEAIHDLIFAQTEEQVNLSLKKFDGQTSQLIKKLKNELLSIIAICEVNIDYPEYDDVEVIGEKELKNRIIHLISEINQILESSKMSRFIFEGLNVAIVGKPNSGKSSLLNALLNEEKAIVSEVAGTTRDVVEGKIQIGQVLLNLKDTAGIHLSSNKIEKQGIDKTFQEINKSDIIIYLVDNQEEDLTFENENFKFLNNKIFIKVINKSDLITHKNPDNIYISAKNHDIQSLIQEIEKKIPHININDYHVINNTRQLSLIESTKIHLQKSLQSLENHATVDTVIVDLQAAWNDLANILGQANHETLLDEMFSSFCLGK